MCRKTSHELMLSLMLRPERTKALERKSPLRVNGSLTLSVCRLPARHLECRGNVKTVFKSKDDIQCGRKPGSSGRS